MARLLKRREGAKLQQFVLRDAWHSFWTAMFQLPKEQLIRMLRLGHPVYMHSNGDAEQ